MRCFVGCLCIICAVGPMSVSRTPGLRNHKPNCLTDYWLTITCTWPMLDNYLIPENTSCWLEFTMTDPEERSTFGCHVVRSEQGCWCTLRAEFAHQTTFMSLDSFSVRLCALQNGQTDCESLFHQYYPKDNIQPIKPHNFTVQFNDSNYLFEWESGYETHPYRPSLTFQYQFLFYKKGDDKSGLRVQTSSETISLDESELDPDSEYEARVRAEVTGGYNGVWSSWSSSSAWRTSAQRAPMPASVMGKIGAPAVLTVGLLIALVLFSTGMNFIREVGQMPTPGPYFKGWQVPGVDTLVMNKQELVSTVDTIEPNPVNERRGRPSEPHTEARAGSQSRTAYVSHLPAVWVLLPGVSCADSGLTDTACEALALPFDVSPAEDDAAHLSPHTVRGGADTCRGGADTRLLDDTEHGPPLPPPEEGWCEDALLWGDTATHCLQSGWLDQGVAAEPNPVRQGYCTLPTMQGCLTPRPPEMR